MAVKTVGVALLMLVVLAQAAVAQSTYVGLSPPNVGPTAGIPAPSVAGAQFPRSAPAPSPLPRTGGDILGVALIGALVIVVGVVLARAARRRHGLHAQL